MAAWEIKRSVFFVNLISAGTRSPAENKTRSPTTNSSVGISINSPSRLTVTLSWIRRSSWAEALFARSSWMRRITPLIRIMEKMIIAVVAFLAKLDTTKTSVMRETIPRTKRITWNGLINARCNRFIIVSFFRSLKLFFPYFSRIDSICSMVRPSGDVPMSR